MALTDQPYIPFFVDDWMNNNKLKCCSAASHGIMISIMCLMHKESDHYGKLLLKQKYKQTNNQIHNFALQVARQTAFDLVDIEPALAELLEEKVLILDDDYLLCERMIRDAELSVKRSISGKKGGQKTQENVKVVASEFAQANIKANTVYEYEYNKDSSIGNVSNSKELEPNYRKEEIDNSLPKRTEPIVKPDEGNYVSPTVVQQTMLQIYKKYKPEYRGKLAVDGYYISEIACKIADFKGWPRESINNGKFNSMVETWELILEFAKTHVYSYSRTLKDLAGDNEWDRFISIFKANENNKGNSGKGKGVKNPEHQQGKYHDFDD